MKNIPFIYKRFTDLSILAVIIILCSIIQFGFNTIELNCSERLEKGYPIFIAFVIIYVLSKIGHKIVDNYLKEIT